MTEEKAFMEEHAIVLDYLAKGGHGGEPTAFVIGEKFFTLLEVVPSEELKPFEKVYVGKEKRDKIKSVKRRVSFDELSSTAKDEVETVVEKIVKEDSKRFVDFFNNAQPMTLRMHQLELLPLFGKKHVHDLLDEREKKEFESLEGISKRIPLLPDPSKAVVKRILAELEGTDIKHFLFVRPLKKKRF